jgi:hypothetical protein
VWMYVKCMYLLLHFLSWSKLWKIYILICIFLFLQFCMLRILHVTIQRALSFEELLHSISVKGCIIYLASMKH